MRIVGSNGKACVDETTNDRTGPRFEFMALTALIAVAVSKLFRGKSESGPKTNSMTA